MKSLMKRQRSSFTDSQERKSKEGEQRMSKAANTDRQISEVSVEAGKNMSVVEAEGTPGCKMLHTEKENLLTITIQVAFELNHGQQVEIYAAVQTALSKITQPTAVQLKEWAQEEVASYFR